LNAFADTFLLTYASLFPIVNPIGSAPIFLSLTRRYTGEERQALARRVAINSFLLLLGSLFVGSHVLAFFGITLPVVRIAGGLVVTAFGWKLLHAGETPDILRKPDSGGVTRGPSDAFYPLTMPLTVGPGSIAVAVTLGSQRPNAVDVPHLAIIGGAAIGGLLAISATVYVAYRFAERMVRLLGEGGLKVMIQLSAFILLCIGVEIVWSGWSALMGATP
jgi:multiple antibiotic resistance protein